MALRKILARIPQAGSAPELKPVPSQPTPGAWLTDQALQARG